MVFWLLQVLFATAAFAGCLAASILILKRDPRAPAAMIAAGACGVIVAVGVILAPRSGKVLSELGEDTATRRGR